MKKLSIAFAALLALLAACGDDPVDEWGTGYYLQFTFQGTHHKWTNGDPGTKYTNYPFADLGSRQGLAQSWESYSNIAAGFGPHTFMVFSFYTATNELGQVTGITNFILEMSSNGADYQITELSGKVHEIQEPGGVVRGTFSCLAHTNGGPTNTITDGRFQLFRVSDNTIFL